MKIRLSSSHGVFAERGDPWITEREAERDYPLNKTVHADSTPQSVFDSMTEARKRAIRDNMNRRADEMKACRIIARLARYFMGYTQAVYPVRVADRVTETKDFKSPRRFTAEVNPDMDMQTKASRSVPKQEPGSDKPIRVISHEATKQEKLWAIASKMNRKAHRKPDASARTTYKPVQQEKKKATTPTGFSVYVKYKDGRETEEDYKTRVGAEQQIRKAMRGNSPVDVVEIWSHFTGEMIADFRGKKK